MKKLLVLLFVLVLLGGAVGTAATGWWWWTQPPGSASESVDFEVTEGMTFSTVADALGAQGLVRWPELLKAYVKARGLGGALKPGTYSLNRGMVPERLVEMLVKGEIKMTTFVIPEGWNIWQVAERLAATFPHVPEAQWKVSMTDPAHFDGLPKEARSLEGYLFPDTYVIRPKAGVTEVLRAMRKAFDKNFSPAIIEAGAARGLSPHAIVTLASIVEKETGKAEERARISAVFHNRLTKKMKLQTDPTVIYGIWERYDGNIRKKDLLLPTPYNTYVIPSLPPGPIANPGRAALEAAVNPLASDELYFVGKGDGSHVFSRRLEDHNKAVYEFQVKPFQMQRMRR
jgi:UPF0755 protein